MTTTTQNEAAERLREQLEELGGRTFGSALVDEALAAERRATVERIRERARPFKDADDPLIWLDYILDEEAAG